MTDGPFPKLDTPFVQPSKSGEPAESGRIIAVPWYRLLITFWNRTGGSLGGVLLAQNNLDDVDSAVTSADNLSTESLPIASGATTDLSLSIGVNVLVTGNANISSFGIVSAGAHRTIRFSGSPTLINSAALILQGGSNTSALPGDVGEFVSEGLGNWRQIGWLPAAQTGTGAEVYATSPALVTPNIGAATGTSLNLSGLTANSAVATNGAKTLVSVTNTGSGNNVLAASPTLITPVLGAASATSINFGGTTLSDYTEFTFTIIGGFSTPGTSTWAYTAQAGRGAKIGRIVQVSYNFQATPTIRTGSGTVALSGFPYSSAGITSFSIQNINAAWTWPVSRTQVACNINIANNALIIFGFGSGLVAAQFGTTNMTSGSGHTLQANGCIEAT